MIYVKETFPNYDRIFVTLNRSWSA